VKVLFDQLRDARTRALHLEMRDVYEWSEQFGAWLAGAPYDSAATDLEWIGVLQPLAERGGDIRRMRIVSEPWTDYIRWEHEVTEVNLRAGERVRWLGREQASDLRLPGNDFWIVDDQILFNITAGDGGWLGIQPNDDPEVLAFGLESFEAAWTRGIDHDRYPSR
jgi:hypothetical protein